MSGPATHLRGGCRPDAAIRRGAIAAALWVFAVGAPALAADADPDWPCVQRLVPEISAGMVWAGPPLEDAGDWHADPAIAELSAHLADRRTKLAEAEASIESFAEAQAADKDPRLSMLFAGILKRVNDDRSTVIDGIKRYARRQKALASRIEATLAEIDALPRGGTPEQEARRAELTEQNVWDSRIYEERERSLAYLCETPVLLEQRVFALGRAIQNFLD